VGVGVTALSNGNYVVSGPGWNGGRGAATWGDGSTGVSGTVSAANSLVGTNDGDRVGSGSVTALSNGNYVVTSPGWNGGRGAATWGSGTTGRTLDGSTLITPQNSLVGQAPNAGLGGFGGVVPGPSQDSFLAAFVTEGGGRVTVGLTDPNQFTFARAQAQTVALTPDLLTATLDSGTAVVLQASNDITVDDPIVVQAGGHGGALTLQAGRSIVLNASIRTDNGALTLIANDTLASGVVDVQRDVGTAVITMAGGTALDTGDGPLTVELRDGAGRARPDSRAINLQAVSAGSVTIVNDGPSPGSDLRLGPVTSSGPQSYSTPHGSTTVVGDLRAADQPITFTDSLAVGDGRTLDAGAARVVFAGGGTQALQPGSGTRFGNVAHSGGGTLQLQGDLLVGGSLTNAAGTFDANDWAVTVTGVAELTGGTYLAEVALQDFPGGLVLVAGTFRSSSGPMTVSGPVAVLGGALRGEGRVGPLMAVGGTVEAGDGSAGLLAVSGALTLFATATFSVRLDGPSPGDEYSQLVAGGPVYLGGSTLSLTLGFEPPVGSSFEVLTTSDPGGITGTFNGLGEGAIFEQDGYQFQITYHGGDNGTSVVLTRLA
jgi:hypothetical protein